MTTVTLPASALPSPADLIDEMAKQMASAAGELARDILKKHLKCELTEEDISRLSLVPIAPGSKDLGIWHERKDMGVDEFLGTVVFIVSPHNTIQVGYKAPQKKDS